MAPQDASRSKAGPGVGAGAPGDTAPRVLGHRARAALPRALKARGRTVVEWLRLPAAARHARAADRRGLPASDPGAQVTLDVCMRWLCRAQDHSRHRDGGVARDYSLLDGWAASYPETTSYIVPTFLEVAEEQGNADHAARARRMLDWLVSIQFPEGGIQGGTIDAPLRVPVSFNTGQILLGLAAGCEAFGAYEEAIHRAAAWLTDTLEGDGCWRRFPTPFAQPGEKTYDVHAAWGLLEAARVTGEMRYRDEAVRNVRWALRKQRPNGWFEDCCLTDSARPLTHTLGYTLRGIVEAYLATGEPEFKAAARRTADALVGVVQPDGRLAGRWTADWRPAVDWVCLTGSVQIAHSLLLLFRDTADARYRDAGLALNRYVRRTVKLQGDPDQIGGVKGSFPVDGAYGRYEFLSWAAKFCIDSNRFERTIRPS